MPDLTAEAMINYLVSAQFPHLGSIVVRPGGQVVKSEQRIKAEELRALLSTLTPEQLKVRYDTWVGELRRQAEATEAARPFNQPYARADFDHWAKMEYWTVDEGIALLLGRSPSVLKWDDVKHAASPVIKEFERIREAAQRAVNWKGLYDGNRPGTFIAWAKRFEYPVPEELEEKVRRFGHFMGDWYTNYTGLKERFDQLLDQHRSSMQDTKATYDRMVAQWTQQYTELSKLNDRAMRLLDDRNSRIAALEVEIERLTREVNAAPKDRPLGQREGDTLRKLVIGLAMRGYGYDPRAARNEAVAQIAGDLLELGLEVTDDTVRKYLREGAELLPPDDAPERTRAKRRRRY